VVGLVRHDDGVLVAGGVEVPTCRVAAFDKQRVVVAGGVEPFARCEGGGTLADEALHIPDGAGDTRAHVEAAPLCQRGEYVGVGVVEARQERPSSEADHSRVRAKEALIATAGPNAGDAVAGDSGPVSARAA